MFHFLFRIISEGALAVGMKRLHAVVSLPSWGESRFPCLPSNYKVLSHPELWLSGIIWAALTQNTDTLDTLVYLSWLEWGHRHCYVGYIFKTPQLLWNAIYNTRVDDLWQGQSSKWSSVEAQSHLAVFTSWDVHHKGHCLPHHIFPPTHAYLSNG